MSAPARFDATGRTTGSHNRRFPQWVTKTPKPTSRKLVATSTNEAKETWRKADGEESLSDKVANAGDDMRDAVGNAGDEVRRHTDDADNRPG